MGFGEQGKRGIFFQGNRNKGLKLRGTGEHKQFWGTGNRENHNFVFGEQGHFFSKGTRKQVSPLGGPQYRHSMKVNSAWFVNTARKESSVFQIRTVAEEYV